MPITISPGQALLIMIDTAQHELKRLSSKASVHEDNKNRITEELNNHIARLKKSYLARDTNEEKKSNDVAELIKMGEGNGELAGYNVSTHIQVINKDPSRRYFETHLAYETLRKSLKDVNLEDLDNHFKRILSTIPIYSAERFEAEFLNPSKREQASEFVDAYIKASSEKYYKGFSKEDREKMKILAKLAPLGTLFSGFAADVYLDGSPILRIYGKGIFSEKNRGRQDKGDPDNKMSKHMLQSKHMGLMKSYMPVPRDDIAESDSAFPYVRVAEQYKLDEKAEWIKQNFAELVHPHSASISGVTLAATQTILGLDAQKLLTFNTAKKLGDFFKCLTSLLLYNSGGHTLHEFFSVLRLPGVRSEFKFMKDFDTINQRNLFYENNTEAFDAALKDTIRYNKIILNKKSVHEELLGKIKLRPVETKVSSPIDLYKAERAMEQSKHATEGSPEIAPKSIMSAQLHGAIFKRDNNVMSLFEQSQELMDSIGELKTYGGNIDKREPTPSAERKHLANNLSKLLGLHLMAIKNVLKKATEKENQNANIRQSRIAKVVHFTLNEMIQMNRLHIEKLRDKKYGFIRATQGLRDIIATLNAKIEEIANHINISILQPADNVSVSVLATPAVKWKTPKEAAQAMQILENRIIEAEKKLDRREFKASSDLCVSLQKDILAAKSILDTDHEYKEKFQNMLKRFSDNVNTLNDKAIQHLQPAQRYKNR